MTEPQDSENQRRFYGRRKGRTLKGKRSRALENLLPILSINLPNDEDGSSSPIQPAALFNENKDAFWFEVGFGTGEHLAAQAKLHPNIGFIGCEPFINGVSALFCEIEENTALQNNIRVWADDARDLMDHIADRSLDRCFLLHPDPWHKTRHHKRRFIQNETLDSFARMLKPGGELRIATDDADLANWMIEKCYNHPDFEWIAERETDWTKRPADWPETRYGQKKLAGEPVYLIFKRI